MFFADALFRVTLLRSPSDHSTDVPKGIGVILPRWLAGCVIVFWSSVSWAQGTVPLEEAPAALTPTDAVKQFKVADGLAISLFAAEPQVSQPLSITFDDRGRMWVLQYRQFPNPNGLKPVRVANWLRTQYDRLPEPPPRGPKGNDTISIYEDTDGDGQADTVTDFLSDLNLASGMALDYGGVLSSSRLIFYTTVIEIRTTFRTVTRKFC